MFEFYAYKNSDSIELNVARAVNNLALDSDIKEKFDFGDFLYVAIKDNKVIGINTYRLEEYNGEINPRFIHIILHPDFKRSKEAVMLLMKAENDLIKRGYKKTWAYILPIRLDMIILARKFNFKDDRFDGKGYYLTKRIGV